MDNFIIYYKFCYYETQINLVWTVIIVIVSLNDYKTVYLNLQKYYIGFSLERKSQAGSW